MNRDISESSQASRAPGRATAFGAALSAVILALSACSDDGNGAGDSGGASSATTTRAESAASTTMQSVEAAGNAADIAFAQGMIVHHRQAVELSAIALDPARNSSAPVRQLASQITAAQEPEIKQMQAMLARWGAPEEMDMSQPHDMSSMEGMADDDEIANLKTLSGIPFDHAWAKLMNAHHVGAVASATKVIETGDDPQLEAMAKDIVTAQTAEIATLDQIINIG